MDALELTLALAGSSALSGAGASLLTAIVGRRQRQAQAAQITAQITQEAHRQIYATYGELLDELRAELAAARAETARLRADLATADAELDTVRTRLDRAEQREAILSAEITRLGGTLPT